MEEMVSNAEEGMKTLIKASVLNKVKKIIVTSSIATIKGTIRSKDKKEHLYDENDYAPVKG